MKGDSGKTSSSWNWPEPLPPFKALMENLEADVCVVGAGMAGLSSAYRLAREGKSVIVLDDGPIAGGETCRTTAHLTNALDDRYYEIERLHGEVGARLAAESHTQAIQAIESTIQEERIDCGFSRLNGYLFVPSGHSIEVLEKELEAAMRAGIPDIEIVPRAPLDFFDTGPALRFGRQGQFHPLQYLNVLVKRILEKGGRIFTGTHVNQVKGGSPALVSTQNGQTVKAGAVIVATNTPFNDWVVIHTKQAAYRTYVVGAWIPKGSVPLALYWDEPRPYHYIRGLPQAYHYVRVQSLPDQEGDLLIVGGEDHKTGQADDAEQRHARLESWARERFPMMQSVDFRWSGQVIEPVDGLAFIGKNPMDEANVYIATGDSGMGMTHGTIASILLTDLICGRKNEWEKIYHPDRKNMAAAWSFALENSNVAKHYADWLKGGEVDSSKDLVRGTGGLLRKGLKKFALYRDEEGELHAFSAVCPHLSCVVAWNSQEKTWDCPCHGSRFNALGKVINGPALSDLSPLDFEEEEVKGAWKGGKKLESHPSKNKPS